MTKKRILHISGSAMEQFNGIGRLLPELIKMQNLYGASFEYQLYCTRSNFKSDFFEVLDRSEITTANLARYDLVIFHGVYFFEYIRIAKILFKLGVKYLIKPHSSLMVAAQKKSRLKKNIANRLFFNGFVERSSGVIFINVDEMHNSIPVDNARLIESNGIDNSVNHGFLRASPVKPYQFVCLSRIDFSHKGFDILLEALEYLKSQDKLQDICLSIYGLGNKKEVDEFGLRISRLEAPNVRFLGPISGFSKFEMLASKNIFVLTSRYEGFPMAVLEALGAGLPCVVTKGVNMSNILESNNVGWECETNYLDFASLLLDVSNQPESQIEEMSKSAIKYIEINHDWKKLILESEANFQLLLEKA